MAIKTKVVNRRGNSIKERLYFPAIFKGMGVTMSHFAKNLLNTSNMKFLEYPEEKPKDVDANYRGFHRLTKHDDGSIKCVACDMCATYCPADCIFIEPEERYDGKSEKQPKEFKIDLLECVFCGYCVEACPHDAIRMDSGIFNMVGGSRESFIVDKKHLLSVEGMKD